MESSFLLSPQRVEVNGIVAAAALFCSAPALLASIVECIGVHTMAPRRQQAQAITATPAGVHTGAQVLPFVGTDPTALYQMAVGC